MLLLDSDRFCVCFLAMHAMPPEARAYAPPSAAGASAADTEPAEAQPSGGAGAGEDEVGEVLSALALSTEEGAEAGEAAGEAAAAAAVAVS